MMRLLFLLTASAILASCVSSYPANFSEDKTAKHKLLADQLRRTVEKLASEIGERNCYKPARLALAADWIDDEFKRAGLKTERQWFTVKKDSFGLEQDVCTCNIIAEVRGTTRPDEVLVIGAHYDSKVAMDFWHGHGPPLPQRKGTPGANDNASGVATTLALAQMFASHPQARTVRFVAFTNEEPPFYQTPHGMGSMVYASKCRAEENQGGPKVIGMFTPETLGCYSAQPRTKRATWSFVPAVLGLSADTDYVAFLSNLHSRTFMRECAAAYSKQSVVPLRAGAVGAFTRRVAWSDDYSFWQRGYPAFAITDTAFLRHDDYHEAGDTPEKLDYEKFAQVVWALRSVVMAVANPETRWK